MGTFPINSERKRIWDISRNMKREKEKTPSLRKT
jgi:hypothetical protein